MAERWTLLAKNSSDVMTHVNADVMGAPTHGTVLLMVQEEMSTAADHVLNQVVLLALAAGRGEDTKVTPSDVGMDEGLYVVRAEETGAITLILGPESVGLPRHEVLAVANVHLNGSARRALIQSVDAPPG